MNDLDKQEILKLLEERHYSASMFSRIDPYGWEEHLVEKLETEAREVRSLIVSVKNGSVDPAKLAAMLDKITVAKQNHIARTKKRRLGIAFNSIAFLAGVVATVVLIN